MLEPAVGINAQRTSPFQHNDVLDSLSLEHHVPLSGELEVAAHLNSLGVPPERGQRLQRSRSEQKASIIALPYWRSVLIGQKHAVRKVTTLAHWPVTGRA